MTIYNYYNEVGGYGHLEISVSGERSMGFYPRDPGIVGRAQTGLGYDVPGYVNFDDISQLQNSLAISTTPVQDALIASYIAGRIRKR